MGWIHDMCVTPRNETCVSLPARGGTGEAFPPTETPPPTVEGSLPILYLSLCLRGPGLGGVLEPCAARWMGLLRTGALFAGDWFSGVVCLGHAAGSELSVPRGF